LSAAKFSAAPVTLLPPTASKRQTLLRSKETPMKRKLLSLGMLSLLCLAAPKLPAQTQFPVIEAEDAPSPELQARVRKLVATLGPDPSRGTCMPNPSAPTNQAKEELIAIGKPATLPLCAVLIEKSQWRRLMAVEALTEIRDPRAFDTLLRTLQTDSSTVVRGQAAEALGELRDAEAVPYLIAALKIRDLAPHTRSPAWSAGQAAEALGKIGDPRAIPALLPLLGSRDCFQASQFGGTHSPLGAEAAKALGKLSGAAEPLMQLLDSRAPRVRVDAAKALGVMKEQRAVPLLLRCLSNDKALQAETWWLFDDTNPNRAAIKALGEIGDKQATLPLLEKLDVKLIQDGKGVPEFYSDIIEALGKIGDPQAVPTLIQLLSTRHPLRETSMIALAHIRTPEVVDPLLDELQRGKQFRVTSEIIKAMGLMREIRALPALQQFLKEEDIGDDAAVAIGQMDSTFLISLLKDENRQVRRSVVDGLGETGGDQAIEVLLTLIRSNDLKSDTLLALGKLGTPDLLPLLEPMMRDPRVSDPWAARRAVIAIKQRYKL
jgi:HEAT repeat protein